MGTWFRRATASGTVLLAAAAAVGFVGGTAHADDDLWISRAVGVYSAPYATSSKVAPDLQAGDTVAVNCWTVGGNVGTYGDVWYHAVREGYTSGEKWIEGWVFAPFVDGAGDFHTGAIPKCP